jgi:hypothetical protein
VHEVHHTLTNEKCTSNEERAAERPSVGAESAHGDAGPHSSICHNEATCALTSDRRDGQWLRATKSVMVRLRDWRRFGETAFAFGKSENGQRKRLA